MSFFFGYGLHHLQYANVCVWRHLPSSLLLMVRGILINAWFFYRQFGFKQTDVFYAQRVKSDRSTVVLLMGKISLLKGPFTQKGKFCHHLLTLMLFQTCMSFFLLLNTKVTKQLMVAIDFHYTVGPICLPTFFKIYSYRSKKLIQVWNNTRVSKWRQNLYILGWTISLNHSTLYIIISHAIPHILTQFPSSLTDTFSANSLTSAVIRGCHGCGGTNAADETEDEQV